MAFVHLHTHTEYSLLDGMNRVTDYVKRVKELGMTAAAITDHGVMYGVLKFYRAAKEAGIKPILGCEVYVAPGSRFEKNAGRGEVRYHHLILLAENNTGYANLLKLVSRGFTEGFYFKPRVDKELLREYHEGLICLSACLAGELPRTILSGKPEEARRLALEYREIFGPENFYLELQDHGLADQRRVNMELVQIARETGIGLVATNDCHYTYREDADAHDILLCIQTNKTISSEDRLTYYDGQFYVKSEAEMAERFSYLPEALENTARIAERCNVEIETGVNKLPSYAVPEGWDAFAYLNDLCTKGLQKRYGRDDLPAGDGRTLRERLDYELGVIRSMGFVDYFLIVWDFIHYARKNGISVGPGRGSAAGSIVSYCLEITNIDPVRYELIFERFLNPERVTMPDIDVDFCTRRRREVIEYVMDRYGREKVVQIATMSTLGAKGVIKDVARAMDLPFAFGNEVTKKIPREPDITLEKALEMSQEFKELYDTDERVHRVVDMAKRLEGLPRNTGTHAAGVVICRERAEEYVPLAIGTEDMPVTQYDKDELESLGLLKMDFLGLTTLDMIDDVERNILRDTGEHVDSAHVEMNDPKVFASLATGHTEGIFQLESAGMRNFMKELKPGSLEDVIAGISLYRPGPMSFIPKYIDGKNHAESITYACPQLEPILAPTYGCIVYQEQVMRIVRELGGYSMGRSDKVRRVMSKKKQDVMDAERKIFLHGNREEMDAAKAAGKPVPASVPGCVENGIPEQIANHIFDEMVDFAKYAFNKSHAASYAVVAYQTAYLKYYYPVQFMAALMTSVIGNLPKVVAYIATCRGMGIEVSPPSVNEGGVGFISGDGRIRYALTAIKGVGESVVMAIASEREKNGPYTGLRNLLERVKDKEMNRHAAEALVKSGALDCLGGTRQQMLRDSAFILDDLAREKKTQISGQMTLFDLFEDAEKGGSETDLPPLGEFDTETLLAMEKEVLGLYISGHPLEPYRELEERIADVSAADFTLNEELGRAELEDGAYLIVGGMISEKTIKYTKTNKAMCFLTLEDLTGSVEVLVFPKTYEQYAPILDEDARIFVRGKVSIEEDKNAKLLADQIVLFGEAEGKNASDIFRTGRRYGSSGSFYQNAAPRSGASSGQRSGQGTAGSGNAAGASSGQQPPDRFGPRIPEKGLFLRFATPQDYDGKWPQIREILGKFPGNAEVVVYLDSVKALRVLPSESSVTLCAALEESLTQLLDAENVKIKY
ncbi:MAG: DNA polymerase III subunit alpha [Lachnospiraceae bacterium]|nr:DNA polymerase III subunit alpha [Lachnospiraceae bacterium]